jgi:hypothetical protein
LHLEALNCIALGSYEWHDYDREQKNAYTVRSRYSLGFYFTSRRSRAGVQICVSERMVFKWTWYWRLDLISIHCSCVCSMAFFGDYPCCAYATGTPYALALASGTPYAFPSPSTQISPPAPQAFLLLPPAPPPMISAPLAFKCSSISAALSLFTLNVWFPPAPTLCPAPAELPLPISSTTFPGSAAPMTGTSLASHC